MNEILIPVSHLWFPAKFDSNELEISEIICDGFSFGNETIIYEHNGIQSEIQLLPGVSNTVTTIEDCETGIIYTIEEFRKKLGK